MRLSELSDHLRIAPRSTTEVVDALESRGLAQRRPDSGDRRPTLVGLTGRGASILDAIRAARGTEAERVFGRLSQTDRAHLAAFSPSSGTDAPRYGKQEPMESSARTWIAALRGSQQRLASLIGTLDPEQLRGPSYDPGWPIAQVLSHIGSQADIAIQSLVGTLAGREPFGPEGFAYILAVWSARDPDQQAAQCLVSDAEHVRRLGQLTDEQLAVIRVKFFGMEFDAVGMVWLRLGEHALHSWDVAVSLDSSAVVAPQSVELLTGRIPQVAMRAGKPGHDRFTVGIRSMDPKREFVLEVADSVTMTAVPEGTSSGSGGRLPWIQMPAEALLRLVYGRLDPDHVPPPESLAGPIDLEALRRTFPGL